jgi:signal transduction histidine kinase
MRLVNDFLDLQKIESGNLTIDQQPTKLSRVVSNAVVRNGLYAEQFAVSYKLQEPLVYDPVSCDAHRIGQVLTNFLSNAAKYGGKNDVIEISMKRIGKRLRVSVCDHGPGIPAEFQAQVYDRFTTNHNAQNNKKKGSQVQSSGLGLSIAKAIIEQHNGQIGFDTVTESNTNSPKNTGTCFWFELPVL